jgi:hypothetical protein
MAKTKQDEKTKRPHAVQVTAARGKAATLLATPGAVARQARDHRDRGGDLPDDLGVDAH